MKHEYHIGRLIGSIAAGMLLANVAVAHDAGTVNDSYVGDSQKHYITSSNGDCVRTGSWKKEDQTVDCGLVPVAKAPPPPPPPPPSYEKFTLAAEALFDHDKSVLKQAGRDAIHAMDQKIKSKGATVVDIDVIGHTDSDGSEEYNQALSLRRANAVRDFMTSGAEGIDASIIDVSGKGELNPVADNRTREGRALNRRVDILVGVKQRM